MPVIAVNNVVPKAKFEGFEAFIMSAPEVDLAAVRERVGNDERLVRMLIGFFIADAPMLVKRLHQAAAVRSGEDLQSLAHNLKGLSANVNANAVRKIAQQLEDDARVGHIEDADSVVTDLEDFVERALVYLKQSVGVTAR